MAADFKCDICESFEEGEPNEFILVSNGGFSRHFDICLDCYKKLRLYVKVLLNKNDGNQPFLS